MAPFLTLRSCVVSVLCLFCLGCSGNESKSNDEGISIPVIVTQPQSTVTPLGLGAVFTVGAAGGNLAYAWSKNGVPIPGAVSSKYMTPNVQQNNSGDVYTVVVSNSAGSVASSPAVLTVSARAPKAGDLRFQNVDAPYTIDGLIGLLSTNINSGMTTSYPNIVGTPLTVGGPGICSSTLCAWFYIAYAPANSAAGLAVAYDSGSLRTIDNDIVNASKPNSVIYSLDIEDSTSQYALAVQSDPNGSGYDMAKHVVGADDLQAAATTEGAEGRVITAISVHSGQVNFISYGWTGDPNDKYDVSAVSTPVSSITTAASQLAAQGYVITACGGDGVGGMFLIGTKVQGDSIPRLFLSAQTNGATADPNLKKMTEGGYSIVGYTFDGNSGTTTWLGER